MNALSLLVLSLCIAFCSPFAARVTRRREPKYVMRTPEKDFRKYQHLLNNPILTPKDEIRLLKEYRLGRIVDQVYHNMTLTKQDFVSPAEVAAFLHTTPEIVERSQKLGQLALKTLIRCNNRLVMSVAKDHQLRGLELQDLMKIGQHGLEEAIERHDPDSGYRLYSIAKPYILGAILTGLAEQLGLTDYAFRLMSKYRVMRHQLRHSLGRKPSNYQIAEALHWTLHQTEKVANISEKHRLKPRLNMYAKLYPWDDESTRTVGDNFVSQYAGDPDKPQKDAARNNEYKALKQYLTETEFRVIVLKHGLENYIISTNEQIAFELEMTVEDVRSTIDRAKEKLKLFPESISLFHRVIERGRIGEFTGDGAYNLMEGITEKDAARDRNMFAETDEAMDRDEEIAFSRPDIYGSGIDEPDYEVPNTVSEMQFKYGDVQEYGAD